MSSDNKKKPENSGSPNSSQPKKTRSLAMESAVALELPFTFAGAVAVGGFIGYYLDKWLHTAPWLLVLFGAFGFVAGIVEIARRFRPNGSPNGGPGGSS